MSDAQEDPVDRYEDPFGLGEPRIRLSEEQTVERMLAAGTRLVSDSGLRISFDLLRIEDVIAEADVSRSAVYKRWPRKEQYYADLLLRLAGDTHPAESAFDLGTPATAVRVTLANLDWLRTAKGRYRLLIEMCRLGALQNFDALRARTDWRINMTLHAALLTLPQNDYRDTLEAALAESERGFIQKMVAFYTVMINVVGFRFKDDSGELGLAEFAALGAAAVEGVLLTSGTSHDLAERRFLMDPFDSGQPQDWSYPAISFTSLVVALFQQEDKSAWGADKVQAVQDLLRVSEYNIGT